MQEHECLEVNDMCKENSLRSSAVKLYLIRASKLHGSKFSAVHALDDLIDFATSLRNRIEVHEIKPFVDDRGRTVRLHEYRDTRGYSIAREIYSPRTGLWYHEAWIE